jgi:protein-S-isoprenylcysteine O-methyltransferase Ste14
VILFELFVVAIETLIIWWMLGKRKGFPFLKVVFAVIVANLVTFGFGISLDWWIESTVIWLPTDFTLPFIITIFVLMGLAVFILAWPDKKEQKS